MKKKFLLFGLSLLACGGSVFADDTAEPGTVKGYADIKIAVEQLGTLTTLRSDSANQYNKWQSYVLNTVDSITYYQDKQEVQSIVSKEIEQFGMEATELLTSGAKIAYRVANGRPNKLLYITTDSIARKVLTNYADWKYYNTSEDESLANLAYGGNEAAVKTVYLCYIEDGVEKKLSTNAEATQTNLLYFGPEIQSLAQRLPKETKYVNVPMENPKYETWKGDSLTAAASYKETIERLQTVAKYRSLTLLNDIEVAEGTESLGTWPAGCEINGKGFKIINKSGNPLFTANNGTLHHLISTDQRIATSNGGKVYDCIVKSSNGYIAYDESGKDNNFTKLEDAVYSLRTIFGMNLTTNEIGAVIDANRLYQVKYTDADTKDEQLFKANIGSGNLIAADYQDGLKLDNVVAYVEDTDAKITFDNVAVKGANGRYTCANLKLTDSSTSGEFYIPYALTATKINYSRSSKDSLVAVCMPFALNSSTLSAEAQVEMYNFKNVDAEKKTMWFNKISSVPANTPCILRTKKGPAEKVFSALENVAVASTKDAELSSAATLTGTKNFFGNYKANQTAGDLTSAHPGFGTMVYGIQGGELVKMADTSHMQAFRSFIIYGEDISKPASNAPFRVGLLDENDNEVNAIESVTTNGAAATFKAEGGDKTIEITSDKARTVNVYTANGTLVKTVRVEAGTTSLPVTNAGMYIVNKNKVVVK